MDGTAIDGTKKEKQNVKSASDSILWEGGLGETAPYQTGSPPLSTLAQEILMAGCDSKARHTRLILNSKAQDNFLHLAARYAWAVTRWPTLIIESGYAAEDVVYMPS
ncbi:hypothetical protein [Mesorhizobium sp. M0520]|uniref:hypothetical protein n=1 Tax=Mesorhizobium sp. M0520 TaxID=2956957 RepID=UPI00333A9D37